MPSAGSCSLARVSGSSVINRCRSSSSKAAAAAGRRAARLEGRMASRWRRQLQQPASPNLAPPREHREGGLSWDRWLVGGSAGKSSPTLLSARQDPNWWRRGRENLEAG